MPCSLAAGKPHAPHRREEPAPGGAPPGAGNGSSAAAKAAYGRCPIARRASFAFAAYSLSGKSETSSL